jgi:tetratricopeptide (TPR) repeat protein
MLFAIALALCRQGPIAAAAAPSQAAAAAPSNAAVAPVAVPAAAAPPPPAKPAAGSVLVAMSFDDGLVETGPDTLTVFQHAKGTVQLSSAFRWSGMYSVEIHDEAGDHDFPELFGSFPLRRSGWLVVHFALLVATPGEPFNIALAGPQRFTLRRDGISFWLQARDGFLLQVSDGIPRRLFPLRAFTWYFVDVDLDLDAGLYDLRISEEGVPRPLVALERQPNAPHQPGSAVEVFSFIGDLEDVSRVTYYVDDLVVGTDRSVRLLPFVAPGRRRLFAESMGDLRRLEDGRLTCLPFVDLGDLGLTTEEVARLRATGRLEPLLRGLSNSSPAARETPASAPEQALLRWREGCLALERGEAAYAGELFQRAEQAAPGAPLIVMAEALAEIARGRTAAAATALGRLTTSPQDPRRAVLEALLLARDGDWGTADARVAGEIAAAPRSPLLAGARYHLLLWQGRFREARAAAQEERLAAKDPEGRALWAERAGDAAFLGRDLDLAEQLYQDALRESVYPQALLCRLADVRFLRGDLAGERELRERVYGSLRPPRQPAGSPAPRP